MAFRENNSHGSPGAEENELYSQSKVPSSLTDRSQMYTICGAYVESAKYEV
jgi:hypothetical protein